MNAGIASPVVAVGALCGRKKRRGVLCAMQATEGAVLHDIYTMDDLDSQMFATSRAFLIR